MKLTITTEHELNDLGLRIEENINYLYLHYDFKLKHPKGIKHNVITVKNILRQSEELREALANMYEGYDYHANPCNMIEIAQETRIPLISIDCKNGVGLVISILKTEEALKDIPNVIKKRLEDF